MGTAIRINDDIYLAAQRVAGAERRSIPQQIEFWALVGKTALENPGLPVDFVRELLISKHTDRALAEPFLFEPVLKPVLKSAATPAKQASKQTAKPRATPAAAKTSAARRHG